MPDWNGLLSLLSEKERALLFSLFFLVGALVLKIFTTILGGSLTQMTDLFRSFSEVLAVTLSIICLRKATRGQNDSYHFGYGKLESLSSLAVAAVIFISFLVLIVGIVIRVMNPPAVGYVGFGLVLAIIFFFMDGYFWRRNFTISLKEYSPVMESQWRLFRTKTLVNFCVIVTLSVTLVFRDNPSVVWVDVLGSVAVGCFMLVTAYRLMTSSVYELIDGTLDESLQILILRELALFFHEYDQFHGWKCRRSGTDIFIDVYLQFDAHRTMGEVQSVMDRMRGQMESAITSSHVNIIPVTSPVK